MEGSSSNKRQVESPGDGDSNSKRQSVNMGLEALECSVCSEPLKPLIFQCSLGHFICLSCSCENQDWKCHLCSVEISFERCFGMEHVVKSVTVPCCNAKYGCDEQVTYYQKEEHEKACLNAPCFCPPPGCGFAGSKMALLGHLTAHHKFPLSTFHESGVVNVSLYLEPGLRVLQCREDRQIFLFSMATEAFGHAISVVCVQPKITEPTFTCHMHYGGSAQNDYQSSSCTIRSSSLSDGLPEGYDLIVPKGKVSDEENGIMLKVVIRGTRKVIYDSGSDSDDAPLVPGRRKGMIHDYSDSDDKPPGPLAARFIPDHSDSDDERPLASRFSKIFGYEYIC